MRENNPLDSFKKTNDLYSFVLALFIFLDSLQMCDVHKAYYRFLNKKGNDNEANEEWLKLEDLVDSLSFCHTIGFNPWKQAWVKFTERTKIPLPVFCLGTLIKIDAIIKDIVFEKDSCRIFEGPISTDDIYCLYLKKPNNSFFSSVFKQENIYPGRTTVSFGSDSINRNFYHFAVHKKSYLFDYTPMVYRYSGKDMSNSAIRVAIVPFWKAKWFRTHLKEDTKTFSISYREYKKGIINQAYKELIAKAEENAADIIIFPELAMNNLTESIIKAEFINAPKAFEHLKLCLLGSGWENRSNISVMMSSSGTVLAKQRKNVPYYHHIKDGIYYREDISCSKSMTLIDIESFGRIAYCICADINESEIQSLIELMEVDFVFVSSYTKNTEKMFQSAVKDASLCGISTILCNARSAKDPENTKKHSNGFCVIPKANNKKLSPKILCYIPDDGENHDQHIFFFDLRSDS